jgi:hypothetical protein
MANSTIALNYALPFTVHFVCGMPLDWEIQRTRTATGNPSWVGTTALPVPQPSQIIPAGTFAVGDAIDWGADVAPPPGVSGSYTITVSIAQGPAMVASMQHTGNVAAAGVAVEAGTWQCI